MNGLTSDDIIDALLSDFDLRWRKIADMGADHPDKAREVCHLDSIRAASCLLLHASHRRGSAEGNASTVFLRR